jgi:hypothetical protein
MIKWLIAWWDKRRRDIDLDILWPQCIEHAKDIDHARAAFFYHVVHDTAWTRHYTEEELYHYVDKLV